MRVLVAFNGEGCPRDLRAAMKSQGLEAEFVRYRNPAEVLADLNVDRNHTAPYGILIHDGGMGDVAPNIVPSVVDINSAFGDSTCQGRFDPDAVIRQAYENLSRNLPNAFGGVVWAGAFSVDLMTSTAKVEGNALELTRKEFSILRALVIYAADKILPKTILNEHIYGVNSEVETDPLAVFLTTLRDKIENVIGSDRYKITQDNGYRGYFLGNAVSDFVPLVDGIEFSPSLGVLRKGDLSSVITAQASTVLELLISANHQTVSKEGLKIKVGIETDNQLKVYFTNIRNAMREVSGAHYIGNEWGKGFFLSKTPVPDSGAGRAKKTKTPTPQRQS